MESSQPGVGRRKGLVFARNTIQRCDERTEKRGVGDTELLEMVKSNQTSVRSSLQERR